MKTIVIGGVLLLAGLALTTYGVLRTYRSVSSAGWPTAEGRMISSQVESIRARRSTTYQPKVAYSYSVGGTMYSGDVIAFSSDTGGDLLSVRAMVDRFPSGSTVTVHYNPSTPTLSCLIAGEVTWRDFVPDGIGLALAGVGGFSVVETARGGKDKKKKPGKS
jgi:hypothetical protein